MTYIHKVFGIIRQIIVLTWNILSLFFGFTYEKQGRKMKDYNMRGNTNPKRNSTVYRPNKVSKD